MVQYEYKKDAFPSFPEGIKREWALTNGIGSYAGSSLIGAHNRTHQGYLIASLHAPTERYLVFSKINETICTKNATFSLETSQHCVEGKTVYAEGQHYLNSFCYDGSIHYEYETGDITLKKHITLVRGENVCAIAYEVTNNGADAQLSLTPLFNFREHSDSSTPDTLCFETIMDGHSYFLIPESRKNLQIEFQVSEGSYSARKELYDVDMQLQTEVDLETPGLDCHYTPVDVSIDLPAGETKKISVICRVITVNETDFSSDVSVSDTSIIDASIITDKSASDSVSAGIDFSVPEQITADTAFILLEAQRKYIDSLYEKAGYTDYFANQLVLASDQFLTHRTSTGMKTVLAGLPWFTDWGRDTMIAFTGLTLCTGRRNEAEEILLTFSKYVKNGIVPNMFPDDNTPPLYNTVDASLWYFYAVYEYLQYYSTEDAYAFIQKNIYPHLKEIAEAYKNGTDFSIYMEEDGLIHAGSGLDQITWMDVRVGEWVVTPRHGKPVEINALWYNALKVLEMLSNHYNEDASAYTALAEKVKASFCEKFWDNTNKCLYDVIDGDPDDHLRPNQIYAVSLPFTMLSKEQEALIVEFVERELYVGCGLRSLSKDHADYHGIYCGALEKRDAAYHQGTAWGFLLGGFITAYLKVHNYSKESVAAALEMLEPMKAHLTDNGAIGSISEIFDGDAPHNPRGCYAQAWSVGETLRCYAQGILPYL